MLVPVLVLVLVLVLVPVLVLVLALARALALAGLERLSFSNLRLFSLDVPTTILLAGPGDADPRCGIHIDVWLVSPTFWDLRGTS